MKNDYSFIKAVAKITDVKCTIPNVRNQLQFEMETSHNQNLIESLLDDLSSDDLSMILNGLMAASLTDFEE